MRGAIHASLQTLLHPSQTMQTCLSGHKKPAKLAKAQNSLLTQKQRAKQFLNNIDALGDMLYCKF